MTPDLLRLRTFLKDLGATQVAMESTASYGKPIFNVLEGHLEVLVVNAQHLKAVAFPEDGQQRRRMDRRFAPAWALATQFWAPAPQRELRDLTRYRISLSEERSRLINRLQKTLEDANIKLASVGSSVMGRSARDLLAA